MNYGKGRNKTLAIFILPNVNISFTIMVRITWVSLILEATKVYFSDTFHLVVPLDFSIKEYQVLKNMYMQFLMIITQACRILEMVSLRKNYFLPLFLVTLLRKLFELINNQLIPIISQPSRLENQTFTRIERQ